MRGLPLTRTEWAKKGGEAIHRLQAAPQRAAGGQGEQSCDLVQLERWIVGPTLPELRDQELANGFLTGCRDARLLRHRQHDEIRPDLLQAELRDSDRDLDQLVEIVGDVPVAGVREMLGDGQADHLLVGGDHERGPRKEQE